MISYFVHLQPTCVDNSITGVIVRNYSLSCSLPHFILFFPPTGKDLEALQIHLCILASDFTTEGQPSLEASLVNVTRKPLPQQTKGMEKETYNKCHFKKREKLVFRKHQRKFGKFQHCIEAVLQVNGFDRQALSKFCRSLIFLRTLCEVILYCFLNCC